MGKYKPRRPRIYWENRSEEAARVGGEYYAEIGDYSASIEPAPFGGWRANIEKLDSDGFPTEIETYDTDAPAEGRGAVARMKGEIRARLESHIDPDGFGDFPKKYLDYDPDYR